MSSPVILISADSVNKSISSSTSLIILSDTVTYLSVVLAIVPEITPEVEVAIVAFPAIPTPVHIIPAPPTIPYRPLVLVWPGQEIPFGQPYRYHPNKAPALLSTWYPLLPSKLSSSSPDFSPSSFGPSSPSSSSSGPSSPSSSSSSSSSITPHLPSGPLHRRRYQSLYSTSLSLVELSRKRCRFPTTSLLAAISTPAVLTHMAVDRLPLHKRFRGSPAASPKEKNPFISPIHSEPIVVERLDKHEETLRDRVAASEGKNTALRKRLRGLELGYFSLRDSLRTARAGQAEM
ncbi:hypothetical protein Tco_0054064 [Tanacetum coccineum]